MSRPPVWPILPALLLACNVLGQATPTVPTPSAPLEPTATSAPAVPAGPTVTPGWLTYHNASIGYSFRYPAEAVLTTSGVTGYPTDELPAGVEPGQYIATLEATYPEAICAGVELPAASFVVWPAQEKGGRYGGPCGVTGIGVYDMQTEETPVTVDGESLTLKTTRLYEVGTDILAHEFAHVILSDGTRLTIMGIWQEHGLSYADYLADRETLLQVLASYQSEP